MDSRNEENLRDLFEKFIDVEQAQNYVEDIEKGEQILRDYPSPEPDDMLIENIKANIALSVLSRRKSHVRKIIFEAVSVAAAIIIIAAINISPFKNNTFENVTENVQVASLFPWENTSADYESMFYEMEQLNEEIFASSLNQGDTDSSRTLIEYAEIKMKLEDVNRSFWEQDIVNQFDTTEYETDQEEFISDFWKGKENEVT
jgi:hypothetical protein